MLRKILDLLIIASVITLIMGIISRIFLIPWPFGIEAQAYLRFTQALLLFAIALGIREILRLKNSSK